MVFQVVVLASRIAIEATFKSKSPLTFGRSLAL
jgi:hypothetical protein